MRFFSTLLILFFSSSVFASGFSQDAPIYQVRYLDDERVLTGDQDGILKLWDIQSSKLLWKSAPLGGAIFSMEIKGEHFALGLGADKKSFVLGEIRNKQPKILKSFDIRGPVQVSFSSDGSMVAVGSGNGAARVYDVESRSLKFESDNKFATSVLRFLPNEKAFLQARDAVHDGGPQAQWQKASLDLIHMDQGISSEAAMEVEAESILGMEVSNELLVVRSYVGEFGHRPHSHHTKLSLIAFKQPGDLGKELNYGQFVNDVAIAKDRIYLALDDGDVEILSLKGEELGLIEGEGESIMDVELSPSKNVLAISDFGGQVRFVSL